MPALRHIVLLSLTVATTFILVSCGDSKLTQCQKIGTITKQVASDTKAITNDGKTKDHKSILKAADFTEKAAKDMEKLEISDPKLKEFQVGFSQMYKDMSKSTRDMLTALNKKNFPAFDLGLKNWQKAYSTEKRLVTGINNYCTSK